MKFLRERYDLLKPYQASSYEKGSILNANENPYEIPEALKEYLTQHVASWGFNRYPDPKCYKLRLAIGKAYGLEKENVICGVGSDELIDYLLKSTLEVGDKVLIPEPSFSMYRQLTFMNSGNVLEVPLNEDFTYNVEALEEVIIKEQPKVIFLCNPNNPTGCILKTAELERLILAAKGIVVVDEAYGEFCEEEYSAVPLIKRYDHLIVLKTFSKAYGLAGIRTGYGLAQASFIEQLEMISMPYNLNTFSQEVGAWAITNKEVFKENTQKIIEERKRLAEGLRQLGIKFYPSQGNFIWTELPEGVFEALQMQDIFIRRMSTSGKTYYRISVGTPEENKGLIEALKEWLHENQ